MNSPAATIDRLRSAVDRVTEALDARTVDGLDDRALVSLLVDAAEARNAIDLVLASASAIVERRSARERGAGGLAQRHGHRNGTSLLQTLTGQPRGEIGRALRAGEHLVPAPAPASPAESDGPGSGDAGAAAGNGAPREEERWRMLLRDAVASGRLGPSQFHAIRVGLGEPPVERYPGTSSSPTTRSWPCCAREPPPTPPRPSATGSRACASSSKRRRSPPATTASVSPGWGISKTAATRSPAVSSTVISATPDRFRSPSTVSGGRSTSVGNTASSPARSASASPSATAAASVSAARRLPPQCEIHHIDHWSQHRGRTDVDDGVPLCRNHRLGLHDRGERITRERDPMTGVDTYLLHAPPDPVTGEVRLPRRLRSRSPRRFTAA